MIILETKTSSEDMRGDYRMVPMLFVPSGFEKGFIIERQKARAWPIIRLRGPVK